MSFSGKKRHLVFIILILALFGCTFTTPDKIVIPTPAETSEWLACTLTPMDCRTGMPALTNTSIPPIERGEPTLTPYYVGDPELAEAIRLALIDRIAVTGYDGEPFCSYSLLMPVQEEGGGKIKAYVHYLCNEFYVACGILREGTSMSGPVALTLEKRAEGWAVEYQLPYYGSQGSNIREIFPTEAWSLLFPSSAEEFNHRDSIIPDLAKNNIRQAEQVFGLYYLPTLTIIPLSPPTATPRPTSFVKLITPTMTPTLDLASLDLDDLEVDYGWRQNNDYHLKVFVRVEDFSTNLHLTSFQKGVLVSGWSIRIYKKQLSNKYAGQSSLILDSLGDTDKFSGKTFIVETTLAELKSHFGDHRDLILQVVDGDDQVRWQDDLYITVDLAPLPEKEYREDLHDAGVITGQPNLLSQKRSNYFHHGDGFKISVPPGGFYSLRYVFDFSKISKTTSTEAMEAVAKDLTVRIFLFRKDGRYANSDSVILDGNVSTVSGFYWVDFSYTWLNQKLGDNSKYYLRIQDGSGNIVKEEFFTFTN